MNITTETNSSSVLPLTGSKFAEPNSLCLSCKFCRDYRGKVSCSKGKPGSWWKLASLDTCKAHRARKVPAVVIPMEASEVRNLLVEAMATVACTLIQDHLSPQAAGAFRKLKDMRQGLDADLDASTLLLPSELPKPVVADKVDSVLGLLSGLEEGDPITEELRKLLADAADSVDALFRM